jgi:hypothetical protein
MATLSLRAFAACALSARSWGSSSSACRSVSAGRSYCHRHGSRVVASGVFTHEGVPYLPLWQRRDLPIYQALWSEPRCRTGLSMNCHRMTADVLIPEAADNRDVEQVH